MVRYYPEEEGTKDKYGNEYPLLPYGVETEPIKALIASIKEECHRRCWGLAIHSINDGGHMEGSMHYRGLAIDFDGYKLDPKTMGNLRQWCTFEEQKDLIETVSLQFPDDLWLWADDMGTHSHVSVHP